MPIFIHQDIMWLQIAMQYGGIELVQVVHTTCHVNGNLHMHLQVQGDLLHVQDMVETSAHHKFRDYSEVWGLSASTHEEDDVGVGWEYNEGDEEEDLGVPHYQI